MRSIHDNNVYSYIVDCESKRIILHTSYRNAEPHEFTDAVFTDVVAHYFEYVLPGNILFAIEEVDLDAVLVENSELFENSWRYGWPNQDYKGDLDRLANWLRGHSVKGFKLQSSYGLSGWVLAREYELRERDKPFPGVCD